MMKNRIAALSALALAAASIVASSPALAGSSPATAQVTAAGFGTPSQIPWASVGKGWVLTDWTAGVLGHPAVSSYLVLTSQFGQRYIVLKKTGPLAHAELLDWSGNGQSALFDTQTHAGVTTLLVVDLRTGAIADHFVVPTSDSDNYQSAGFTRPNGFGVIVATYTTHYILTRYSLSGQPQVTYPSSAASVGKLTGWLYQPDGSKLALGGSHGLAIVANDGTTVRALHLPARPTVSPRAGGRRRSCLRPAPSGCTASHVSLSSPLPEAHRGRSREQTSHPTPVTSRGGVWVGTFTCRSHRLAGTSTSPSSSARRRSWSMCLAFPRATVSTWSARRARAGAHRLACL